MDMKSRVRIDYQLLRHHFCHFKARGFWLDLNRCGTHIKWKHFISKPSRKWAVIICAIPPTSKLAFPQSHVDHVQGCGSGSRQFQFLEIILVEGNRTRIHAIPELPTSINKLAFASLLHCRIQKCIKLRFCMKLCYLQISGTRWSSVFLNGHSRERNGINSDSTWMEMLILEK
jgi:hypothetical protein